MCRALPNNSFNYPYLLAHYELTKKTKEKNEQEESRKKNHGNDLQNEDQNVFVVVYYAFSQTGKNEVFLRWENLL